MRVVVELDSFKVAALEDTGSDYDAIDQDLSIAQEEQQNPAFRGRVARSISVFGFSDTLNMKSEKASRWEVTLRGADVPGGSPESRSILALFTEFKGLGDPIIMECHRSTSTEESRP